LQSAATSLSRPCANIREEDWRDQVDAPIRYVLTLAGRAAAIEASA
jgi:hypothetical protein